MAVDRFEKPVDRITLEMAFGRDMKQLLPTEGEIPKEFWIWPGKEWYSKLVTDWFFMGVKNLALTAKPGIDIQLALRHIKTILGSFEPQHEHKEAACGFLLDKWFTGATWERAKKEVR